MAATIRFLDGHEFEQAVRVFQRYGEAVPTILPDAYYVSDATLQRLRDEAVQFDLIDPTPYGFFPVTEEMFAELRQSYEDLRTGKLVTFADPKMIEDALNSSAGNS
jgi:hypothetical protein